MAAVGDGNDVCRFVDAALEGAFVTGSSRVRVRGIEWGVSGFAVSGEGAVGAVDGVEEVVEEAFEDVVGFVDGVVGLEEDRVLGINDWVGDLEIEVRLWAGGGDRGGSDSAVNGVEGGRGALRDVGGEGKEKFVKVSLRVDVAEVFKDAKFVSWGGKGGVGDVVESFDAGGCDCCVAD